MDETSRTAALEGALQDAIDYLEALPPHPMTRRKIQSLRARLEAPFPTLPSIARRALVGKKFDVTGVEMLRAELIGDTVYLSTVVDDRSGLQLLEQLRQGRYGIQLKRLDDSLPLTSLESTFLEKIRG